MGLVLGVGAAAEAMADPVTVAASVHAYHQHIHVVVAEGTGKGFLIHLGKRKTLDGFPVVLNVAGGTVGVGTGFTNPVVYVVFAPVAGGE